MSGQDSAVGVTVMTFPLGLYGDNHVEPDALFDLSGPSGGPPPDAVDMQFRVPSSLNLMLDGMARAAREDLLEEWRRLFLGLAGDTVGWVQRSCGWVVDTERVGLAPARLAITAVTHAEAPGFDTARWHLHVYTGATGTSLLDGRILPVDHDSLDIGMRGPAWRRFITQLEQRTSELWGVRWDAPELGAEREIVEPAWHEFIVSLDRGSCPGPPGWGPRTVMVADAEIVQMAADSVEQIGRAHAEGRGWSPPTLLFEHEDMSAAPRDG